MHMKSLICFVVLAIFAAGALSAAEHAPALEDLIRATPEGQPVPVVLTRFIAATQVPGDKRELLLDGCGAAGMPGGPVFIERDAAIYLLGMYTGSIFPDQAGTQNAMALGICCDMTVCWKRMPLQPYTVAG